MKNFIKFCSGNDPDVGGEGAGEGKAFSCSLVLLAVLISACSIKKDEKNVQTSAYQNIEEMLDSDGDGIPDSMEIQRNTNPYIADIPRIKISNVNEVSIGGTFRTIDENNLVTKEILLPQKFNETIENKNADKDFLKVLRKKVLENQVAAIKNTEAEKIDKLTNEDLRSSILSGWDHEAYYKTLDLLLGVKNPLDNESGKVSMSFKVKLTDTLGVSEVSNIKLKTFFYDYKKMEEQSINSHSLLKEDGSKEKYSIYKDIEANPVSNYKIVSTDINVSKISDMIKARSEVGIKFYDYDYISSGINLNFSTVIQKALDHDAKIIFSEKNKTEVFFVAPQFSLEEALKLLGKKVVKDAKGGIYSINQIESTANLPIDFDTISKSEYNNGLWSIIGDADSLSSKLVEKGFYVISYASIKELVDAEKSIQTYPEATDVLVNGINLEKITTDDEVTINVNELKLKLLSENISIENINNTPPDNHCPNVIPRNPNTPPGRIGCNHIIILPLACNITHASINEILNDIDINPTNLKNIIDVKNELSEKIDFSSYFAGNTVKVVFDKPLPMQRNNLTVYLKNSSPEIIARSGVIANTCGGSASYSTTKFKPIYLFKKEAFIYSHTKY